MNKKNILNACGAVLIAAIIFAGIRQHGKGHVEGQSPQLGAVLALSGENAQWGNNARAAMEIVLTDLNKSGGINGKPLTIVYEDSKGEATSAVSAFRKLVDIDKVPAVMGDMMSSTTLAMAPLANDSKVVLMGIGSSAPAMTTAGPFIYRVVPSDVYEGSVFADYVNAQHLKHIGILYLNNDYGTGLKESFKTHFVSLGGSVVSEESYDVKDTDFKSAATKMIEKQPEAIYIVGYYEDTARAVKGFREAGVQVPLLGTSSSINDKLFQIAGNAAEGFTAALINDFDAEALTVRQKDFATRFHAATGKDPDWAATHAADALLVFADCLKKGSKTGDAVRQTIDSVKSFEGMDLGVQFDANGDVIGKPIAVQQAKAGKFVTIWKQH